MYCLIRDVVVMCNMIICRFSFPCYFSCWLFLVFGNMFFGILIVDKLFQRYLIFFFTYTVALFIIYAYI